MATSKELAAQIAALQKQHEDARRMENAAAVQKVRELIKEHGLTLKEIGKGAFAKEGGSASTGKTVNPPKYRDPASSGTWTGVGKMPTWLKSAMAAGKKKSDFLIAPEAPAPAGASKAPGKGKVAAKKAPAKKAAAAKKTGTKKAA